MAENMERRDFIKSAGLVAGIAAASTLGQRSANAETAQQPGAKRMAYEIKPFSLDPKSVKGISEKILISHYENNYVGAVKRLNAIAVQLAELDFAKAPNFLINGLKREELVAMNSMILHEAYFDSLGGAVRHEARWETRLRAISAASIAGAPNSQRWVRRKAVVPVGCCCPIRLTTSDWSINGRPITRMPSPAASR